MVYTEALESPRLCEENLELNPRQGIFGCLISTLVLASTKADPTAKEQNCKQGMVGDYGAGGIEVIFILPVGLRVRDNWLEPGGINPCRTCHCPKAFLGVPDGSCGGD